jgi:xanthine dehydrogenase accessory factor
MKALLLHMARLLGGGESLVTATIVSKSGSAPRSDGSRMVVRHDGSILGSVGGGRLEADTLQLAAEVFRTRRAVLLAFDLTGADAAGSEMICGGRCEILVDFVDADVTDNARMCAEAAELLARGGSAWLLTSFDAPGQDAGPAGQHCLLRPDGSTTGALDCEPALLERLVAERGRRSIRVEPQGDRRILVEPIRDGGRVLVFGAGHCSQKLAPLAESVGFRTVVLDDRAEFASRACFPEPTRLELLESFDHLPDLGIDESCYLVIMTRGHLHDLTVLEQCLRTHAGYIGMIGSVRKRNKTYEELLRRGFASTDFERVHAPIGVEIEAETPEEIAISIVGELIKVRAERERRGTRRMST